jgi:protease I
MLEKSINSNVAVLAASGFSELEITTFQKKIVSQGACLYFISPEQGLVNSWRENRWGLNYPVDISLNTALASDYSSLVMPGGKKSSVKLVETAHTKRLISSFLESGKPVVAINDAVKTLGFCDLVLDKKIACSENVYGLIEKAGGKPVKDEIYIDQNLLTINQITDQDLYSDVLIDFVLSKGNIKQAA